MIYANLKTVVSSSLMIVMVVLMTVYAGSHALAAGPENKVPTYEAGTLLKGDNHALYYITESGTRQFIYDDDTFSAFGFRPQDVVPVDDDTLAELPLSDVLTRLVLDDEDNLYWVADGRRWQVNAWKEVVNQPAYKGGIIGHLDGALEAALPVQVGLKNRTFLRQDGQVYYFSQDSILPLNDDSYEEADVIDVPSGVLAIYPERTTLETLWTNLNETPAAYVRSGPGTDFEVINTVYDTDTIIVKGRAEDSYWLQIKYRGQTGWLAGDLVQHQPLFKFLPTIDTSSLKPAQSRPQTRSQRTYEGVGGYMSTNEDRIPMFSEVMKGYPAHRAGIERGDLVMKIDGEDATTLSVHEAVERIRGPKGTEVV